jgi:predicted DNA-binding mobile mystery protein A
MNILDMTRIASRQRRALVDRAATATMRDVVPPAEGWIATVRKALGMSAAELGRRLGVSRSRVAQAETAELDGGPSLKTMQAMADAMGCRFIYAIVPEEGTIDDLIIEQARRKANALVARAHVHMAFENQALTAEQDAEEVERIAQELRFRMPRDFWSEP